MPDCSDYKTAYETLSRAIDEAISTLSRARLMTSAGLRMQNGETLDTDLLDKLKQSSGPT